MPQPHEQKLHEVVNSFTFESFNFWVAALTVDKSRRPSSASPTLPPTAVLNQSLRLILIRLFVDETFHLTLGLTFDSLIPVHRHDSSHRSIGIGAITLVWDPT